MCIIRKTDACFSILKILPIYFFLLSELITIEKNKIIKTLWET